MRTDELDFHLPHELVAQTPSADRAASRLLHYRRSDRSVVHRAFADLPTLLGPGDLLVFNDAKVIPARFTLIKPTGGRVEGLFIAQRADRRWDVLLKNLGPVRLGPADGTTLRFLDDPDISACVVERAAEGRHVIDVSTDLNAIDYLHRVGRMPLPPYIKGAKDHDERDDSDRERYQTVFARSEGSVAAPTAGLHFTPGLLEQLDRAGVLRTTVTLDVGLGTFKPVTAERMEDHQMHVERYHVSASAAEALNAAKRESRRIVAIGTTSARVLESQPASRPFEPRSDETGILIYPPYQWRHVGAMVTNFHLPRSTLIALVAALIGLDEQRRVYCDAIDQHYRFFSYGDAMFVE